MVWIDVLCIDHAQVGALNDAAAIQAAISRIDCVLMVRLTLVPARLSFSYLAHQVSSPWHSPLTLAWPPSLWMAYCALAGPSKKLSIVLTESEHSLFASTVSDHVPFIRYWKSSPVWRSQCTSLTAPCLSDIWHNFRAKTCCMRPPQPASRRR